MAAPRKGSVLTSESIIALGVITTETYNEDCIRPASYDLRVGDEYYVPRPSISTSEADDQISNREIKKCSNHDDELVIPKFSSVVFSTEEILNMPGNVIGRFDMRISYALKGLVLQVGPQVEPHYKGKLFGLLLNFSDKDIHLRKGDRLLTIEFSYTRDMTLPRVDDDIVYDSLFSFLSGRMPVKGTLETFMSEIMRTYEENKLIQQRIEKKEQDINVKKNDRVTRTISIIAAVFGIIAAIVIPIVILFFTKATYDRDSYPSEILYEYKHNHFRTIQDEVKQDNDSLRIVIDKYKEQNELLHQSVEDLKNDNAEFRKTIEVLLEKADFQSDAKR